MVKRVLVLLVIVFIAPCFLISVNAQETSLPEEYDDIPEGIPDDLLELLPDNLFHGDEDEIINAIEKMTSWEFILDSVFEIIGLNLPTILRSLGVIISILALSSILNLLKSTFKSTTLGAVINYLTSAVIVTSILELSREPLERSMLLLEQIKYFVNTLSPVMCSMYAMGGNVASAVVHSYGLLVFLTLFENVCIISLQMILGVCLSLALVSSFMQEGSLLKMSEAIKKTFTFIVGFFMLVFTTVISAQNLIATKSDSLTAKTAKMFATQMIPVVGSTVGESLRTAGASVDYLRSNIGIALIIILVLMILPVIISISLYRIVFVASNAISCLLGCEKEGKLMLEISSIYGYVLAIISICSIALLFLLTLFAKCSSVLV